MTARSTLLWPIASRSRGHTGAAAPPRGRNAQRRTQNALTLIVAVRVRIAPSPTGDPHVGTAYVSLFNAALARQQGGQFVLRIEDTDRGRYVENSENQIFDLLHWLGFQWDEGPDRGGPLAGTASPSVCRSIRPRLNSFSSVAIAYHCWWHAERLDQMRAEQTRNKQPPGYDRRCLG